MKLENTQQFHFGVYGICNKGDDVLVIKKGRGPYKGLYDLPGGRIEFGEHVATALTREYQEEIGVNVTDLVFVGYNEYFCKFVNDHGEVKDFHHVGLYFTVVCDTSVINVGADGHDSLGALFVPKHELGLHNCSQIALEVLERINKKQ
ncbi:MAG: NUDIX domain-containing protein [Candidatus Pacebacteria bacterium]|nr:NUDIX domain-containing protein [Candidatus Paceibacterota bacterium]